MVPDLGPHLISGNFLGVCHVPTSARPVPLWCLHFFHKSTAMLAPSYLSNDMVAFANNFASVGEVGMGDGLKWAPISFRTQR